MEHSLKPRYWRRVNVIIASVFPYWRLFKKFNMQIDYSKSQKKLISGMPKMTTEERTIQYKLARDIINRNRELGKKLTKK